MVKSLVKPLPGARIRDARKEAHLSAEELAYRLGITTNTVYRWERGAHSPTVGMLRLVAAATGKSLAFFLETEAA